MPFVSVFNIKHFPLLRGEIERFRADNIDTVGASYQLRYRDERFSRANYICSEVSVDAILYLVSCDDMFRSFCFYFDDDLEIAASLAFRRLITGLIDNKTSLSEIKLVNFGSMSLRFVVDKLMNASYISIDTLKLQYDCSVRNTTASSTVGSVELNSASSDLVVRLLVNLPSHIKRFIMDGLRLSSKSVLVLLEQLPKIKLETFHFIRCCNVESNFVGIMNGLKRNKYVKDVVIDVLASYSSDCVNALVSLVKENGTIRNLTILGNGRGVSYLYENIIEALRKYNSSLEYVHLVGSSQRIDSTLFELSHQNKSCKKVVRAFRENINVVPPGCWSYVLSNVSGKADHLFSILKEHACITSYYALRNDAKRKIKDERIVE